MEVNACRLLNGIYFDDIFKNHLDQNIVYFKLYFNKYYLVLSSTINCLY